eukprot:g415.t1
MALWTGSFTEDAYSSRLDFSISENNEFLATYMPPTIKVSSSPVVPEGGDVENEGGPAIESSNDDKSQGPGGKAALKGTVEELDGGMIRITGEWKHQTKDTPFHHLPAGGHFEMVSKQGASPKFLGPMQGFWWIKGKDDEKHSWLWSLRTEKVQERCTERLAKSVHMDRFGMACGWLFLIQTVLQLASFIETWSVNADMNTAFNIDYSILYFAFLLAYVELGKVRPHWTYIMGVFLYFLGYVLFAALYAEAGDAESLYHGGSWLFLVGSLFLMYATKLDHIHEYNPLAKSSALFWGSTCFALGSVFFAMDAASSGINARANGIAGYGFFVLGRIYFVRGSQTKRCSVLFTKNV